MSDWPFDDPRDLAVITLRQIMVERAPILHVTHDSDDCGWQFLGWEDFQEQDAMIVGLGEIVERDPSVTKLADLPIGWHAWRRTADEPWVREPDPHDCLMNDEENGEPA